LISGIFKKPGGAISREPKSRASKRSQKTASIASRGAEK
jgi:hypothetical protein